MLTYQKGSVDFLYTQLSIFTSFFQNGTNPLMKASQKGHLSVVELLVSEGAEVNSQNNVSHLECRYTHTGFSNKTSVINFGL